MMSDLTHYTVDLMEVPRFTYGKLGTLNFTIK